MTLKTTIIQRRLHGHHLSFKLTLQSRLECTKSYGAVSQALDILAETIMALEKSCQLAFEKYSNIELFWLSAKIITFSLY